MNRTPRAGISPVESLSKVTGTGLPASAGPAPASATDTERSSIGSAPYRFESSSRISEPAALGRTIIRRLRPPTSGRACTAPPGAATGLAFYAKEHSALLLPIFLLALLATGRRAWLRRPHPYLACALFVVCLAPDLYWNVTKAADAKTSYGVQPLHQVVDQHLEPRPRSC